MLAVECLKQYSHLDHLRKIADADLFCRAAAERAFTRTIGGDCHTPLGAYAIVDDSQVMLHAFYVHAKRGFVESRMCASRTDAESLGIAAAHEVLA